MGAGNFQMMSERCLGKYIVKSVRAIKFHVTAEEKNFKICFLSIVLHFLEMINFFLLNSWNESYRLEWTAINHIFSFSTLQVNGAWSLPNVVCDFYIAMDVICSTSSIFNLVAISIDRWVSGRTCTSWSVVKTEYFLFGWFASIFIQ